MVHRVVVGDRRLTDVSCDGRGRSSWSAWSSWSARWSWWCPDPQVSPRPTGESPWSRVVGAWRRDNSRRRCGGRLDVVAVRLRLRPGSRRPSPTPRRRTRAERRGGDGPPPECDTQARRAPRRRSLHTRDVAPRCNAGCDVDERPGRDRRADGTRARTSWLSSLGDAERAVAQRAFPSDDDRRQWFYTPTDHGGLALGAMSPSRQQGALRLLATRTERGRLQHGRHDHRAREHPRRQRGMAAGVRPRTWTRPGHVLRACVRRARAERDLGVAFRRPPRVDQPSRRRRRGSRDDAMLHGRRSGVVAAPRPAPAAPAWRGGGSRA